jgi:hypothetical protein
MELVKAVLRLSLSAAFNPWVEIRGIIRELGGEPKAEIEGPPVIMDLKEKEKGKRRRVVLHVKAIEFQEEGVISLEENTAAALDKMAQGNKVSKFPDVKRVWHEVIYIEPYALPFHELLILVKNRFIKASELASASTDVGIIFDQAEGDILKHYQFGPMAKEQLLSMFLNWPRDDLPDNFVFLGLRYEQNRAFTFEREYLKRFLEAANEWEVNQANWLFSYLREKGD